MSKLADLIWKNAELLRGAYKENEYRKVILPFTILRRLDCVLQPTREAVRARYAAVHGKGYDLDKMLTQHVQIHPAQHRGDTRRCARQLGSHD